MLVLSLDFLQGRSWCSDWMFQTRVFAVWIVASMAAIVGTLIFFVQGGITAPKIHPEPVFVATS